MRKTINALLLLAVAILAGCVTDITVGEFDEQKLRQYSLEDLYATWHAGNRDHGTAFYRQLEGRQAIILSDLAKAQLEKVIRADSGITEREHDAALQKHIFVGMSERAMRLSLGKPLRQNRHVSASGEFIQHVYGNYGTYVYTQNGIITSWQD